MSTICSFLKSKPYSARTKIDLTGKVSAIRIVCRENKKIATPIGNFTNIDGLVKLKIGFSC